MPVHSDTPVITAFDVLNGVLLIGIQIAAFPSFRELYFSVFPEN